MSLRRIHLLTACILLTFIAAHLVNHLFAAGGAARHIAVMETLRIVYRFSVVEAVLLAAFTLQAAVGLKLLWRARNNVSGIVGWAQIISGAYLAFFLIVHIGAVLAGRSLLGLDTNFWFAVAGYSAGILKFWFAPYYFLAVVAVFVHLGCAAYWLSGGSGRLPRALFSGASLSGVLVSAIISGALMGGFEDFEVPARYLEPYAAFL